MAGKAGFRRLGFTIRIAKEAGISRSRIGQLLPIGLHPEMAATIIEAENLVSIDSLRRRSKS